MADVVQVNKDALRPLEGFERVDNKDGTHSTEITTTVQFEDGWVNIPTLWVIDGKIRKLTEEQAVKAAKTYERLTSRRTKRYELLPDAENAAHARTLMGGVASGPLFVGEDDE